jgi:hypothetical protein
MKKRKIIIRIFGWIIIVGIVAGALELVSFLGLRYLSRPLPDIKQKRQVMALRESIEKERSAVHPYGEKESRTQE